MPVQKRPVPLQQWHWQQRRRHCWLPVAAAAMPERSLLPHLLPYLSCRLLRRLSHHLLRHLLRQMRQVRQVRLQP